MSPIPPSPHVPSYSSPPPPSPPLHFQYAKGNQRDLVALQSRCHVLEFKVPVLTYQPDLEDQDEMKLLYQNYEVPSSVDPFPYVVLPPHEEIHPCVLLELYTRHFDVTDELMPLEAHEVLQNMPF